MAEVYTFRITFEGVENKIWRKVEVSSKYRLDRFAYMILCIFETKKEHLFNITYNKNIYGIPNAFTDTKYKDCKRYTLEKLKLSLQDVLYLHYDFRLEHTFKIELLEINEMQRGKGTHYPYVIEGEGFGILDGISLEETKKYMMEMDTLGKTKEPIYYTSSHRIWNYKDFDLKCMNALLKGDIELCEWNYAFFWKRK